MVAITGDTSSVDPTTVIDASSSQERIVSGLLSCVARWGLSKTTIEDIARDAGVSRATVYRLYPGGKDAVLEVATGVEVGRLVQLLRAALAGVDDRTEGLSRALHIGASFLIDHEALTFMREHEPVEFARLVRLDQLDSLLVLSAELLAPELRPLLDSDEQSVATSIWMTRLVVSHLVDRSSALDLTDPREARRMVERHIVPGLAVGGP